MRGLMSQMHQCASRCRLLNKLCAPWMNLSSVLHQLSLAWSQPQKSLNMNPPHQKRYRGRRRNASANNVARCTLHTMACSYTKREFIETNINFLETFAQRNSITNGSTRGMWTDIMALPRSNVPLAQPHLRPVRIYKLIKSTAMGMGMFPVQSATGTSHQQKTCGSTPEPTMAARDMPVPDVAKCLGGALPVITTRPFVKLKGPDT